MIKWFRERGRDTEIERGEEREGTYYKRTNENTKIHRNNKKEERRAATKGDTWG